MRGAALQLPRQRVCEEGPAAAPWPSFGPARPGPCSGWGRQYWGLKNCTNTAPWIHISKRSMVSALATRSPWCAAPSQARYHRRVQALKLPPSFPCCLLLLPFSASRLFNLNNLLYETGNHQEKQMYIMAYCQMQRYIFNIYLPTFFSFLAILPRHFKWKSAISCFVLEAFNSI